MLPIATPILNLELEGNAQRQAIRVLETSSKSSFLHNCALKAHQRTDLKKKRSHSIVSRREGLLLFLQGAGLVFFIL